MRRRAPRASSRDTCGVSSMVGKYGMANPLGGAPGGGPRTSLFWFRNALDMGISARLFKFCSRPSPGCLNSYSGRVP
ncbi:protein of unknown function [Azospirillum baldaniorum]|uniref:Uncharacterized protein n=1 Tax=Azospirillum baldaniorum TaxID=1064539 RepID=A0A9P1JQ19_9PROT|nr:protein of unknown function [Azospirillum baldaniorum]